MTTRENVISTLNDLIEISKDGEEGFRTAAEDVKDANLKKFFIDRSHESAIGARELQGLVSSYGGVPAKSSTLAGALHRRWTDLKAAIASNDSVAVLNEAERGEDIALATYRKAVSKDLPQDVKVVIERQLVGVQRNHDMVKQLRDSARAAAH